ncbi:MAG TPA: MFS transporter, partial [Caulobacteraceae bacterium]|nr:MFS transporter [Caulobacteraceae bacterium]
GGGWIVGLCYVAIGAVVPERLWARMFAATAGVWGVATLLGPLVGGLAAAAGHWRWAFWAFAAQGLAFAAAAVVLLAGARPAPGGNPRRGAPWRTLVALAAAVGAVGAADIAPGLLWPPALVATGLILLALAGWVNGRPGERLLPRDAARPATTAGAGYAMIVTMEASTMAYGVYGAAILQVVYGLSPLAAGYAICSLAAGWTVMAFVVADQPERRHAGLIRAGAGLNAVGIALLALVIGLGHLWLVVGAGAVTGAGFGLCWSLATRRILIAVPPEDQAAGSSAVPTCQLIGGAVGAAAAGAMANLVGLAHGFGADRAVAAAPWLFAAFIPLAALGWLAALRLTRPLPAGAKA